jgi:hypothetical protein
MIPELPARPDLDAGVAGRIEDDYLRFARELPADLEQYCRDAYGLNLESEYAGLPVKNPFGKGSGQLSLATHQVARDAEAGLGFVVLKTVIAENAAGAASMQAWAIKETHMAVERIRGADGSEGWTVTWKGRGWHESFARYLEFFGEALRVAAPAGMLVVPSCKYHLPEPGASEWRRDEYDFTTAELARVWRAERPGPMPLEKDFSPTLAGSSLAAARGTIVDWLRTVPALVRAAVPPGEVRIGLKIFNAMFDDAFQLEMLDVVHAPVPPPADFLVYGNRLFDPERVFEGKKGVAYGGPDLGARNLRVLARWRDRQAESPTPLPPLELSGTGDIASGRRAAEYLLRGAATFQMHTFFQLPDSEYASTAASRTARALHRLLFHPVDGFVAWLLHLRRRFGWSASWNIKELADRCARQAYGAAEDVRATPSVPGGA